MSQRQVSEGWWQTLSSGAQWQDEHYKLKHKKFHLNMKNLFMFEDNSAVEQVALGGCGVSLSADIEKPTWTCSYVTCSRWPYLGRELGPDDFQGSLPALTILWLWCAFCFPVQGNEWACPGGTLETCLWISDKVAVKTIRLHSGFWLFKVCKSEAAAGGDTDRMTCQRLYLLRLLLQGKSEGENKNLS